MELKEGMYVRNNHFGIGKINKEYFDDNSKHWFNVQFNCYKDEDCHCGICEETIGFKASYNIIDLIEVGDYVNGLPVCINYWKSDNKWHLEIPDSRFISKIPLEQVNIQSIVTKEQFSQMEYRLGD